MNGAKALFTSVMQDSTNTTVDPRACLPLTKVRETSKSGVMRLKRIFNGTCKDLGSATTVGESIGFIAGSDNPIIIPLQGTHARYVVEHFVYDRQMSESEAIRTASSRNIWYGVVDGLHRMLAVTELMDEDPEKWEGFSWPVTVLKGGHSLQVLRQLARHQNIKHSQNQYVETTFYDQMKGLKAEAERLMNERTGRRITSRDVADAYDGCGGFTDRTMKQMASTAMRLPDEVISLLGEIINSEHPDLVDLPGNKRAAPQTSHDADVMSTVDCRVYRRFMNITSLKQATSFMRGEGLHGVKAQLNAIYRCRDICKQNGFKPVSFRIVSEQYKNANAALDECRKFERLMESEDWPYEMETMKTNLQRTTKFDEEISRNSGNDTVVLRSLVQKYKLVCPALASVKLEKYKATFARGPTEMEVDDYADEENTPLPQQPVPNDTEQNRGHETSPPVDENCNEDIGHSASVPGPTDGLDKNHSAPIADLTGEEPPMEIEPPKLDVISTAASERLKRSNEGSRSLENLHIDCHQMKWQEFDKSVVTDDTPLFDLVLTDPPYGVPENPARAGTKYRDYLDDEEMKQFSQFCRRILLPGGYVFAFTSARYFNPWLKFFREARFKVSEYPFIINKDSTGLQGSRLEDFPQNSSEFAIMARAPGKSPTTFKPDFRSPFIMFPSSDNRRFASMTNVPVPTGKLTNGVTKSPLLVEEKNPEVLAEIITTFSPQGARVIDCYGGTLTTAIAAMMTRRKCVCIEMSAEIYRFAIDRLYSRATNYIPPACKERRTENAQEVHASSPSCNQSVTRLQTSGDSTCGGNSDIIGNAEVVLRSGGEDVGRAILQSAKGSASGPIVRSIHGKDLCTFQSGGEDLVAVLNVRIDSKYGTKKYPYKFYSHDDLPSTLGDIYSNGVYAWDANAMRSLSSQ